MDQVGRIDRPVAEAQMRNGNAAGFFRVIGKVGLRVERRFIADNFDRAFIGPHGAVRAHAPKFTGGDAGMRDRQRLLARGQRSKGHIIDNPEGKPVHRQRFIEVIKDRRDIVGQNILTAKRIAAADD